MVIRRLPRQLRSSALALPLVMTLGCSSTSGTGGVKSDPQVFRGADGWCQIVHPVSCPPDTMCNPPPPMRTDCPADLSVLTHDGWQPGVGRVDDGTCMTVAAPTCVVATEACTENLGPTTTCPDDPKALRFDRYKPPEPPELPKPKLAGRILRQVDGTCISLAEPMKCPPKATCNPPPPKRIECPTDPKDIHTDLLNRNIPK